MRRSKRRRGVLTIDEEMILEFWDLGYSVSEISLAMGIDEAIVRAVIYANTKEV